MQYMPGWWDTIKDDAMGFTNQLMRQVNPNHFAQKDFEQIAKQNPQVISQIANMSPEERAALEQSMGFRAGGSSFAKIPDGMERTQALKHQKRTDEAEAADPDAFRKRLFGTRTVEDRAKEGIDIKKGQQSIVTGEQEQKINAQTIALNGLKLDDAEMDLKEQKRLRDLIPDIGEVDLGHLADAVVTGKQVDNNLLARINSDKNISKVFGEYINSRQTRLQIAASKAIADKSTRTTVGEKVAALGVFKDIVDNSGKRLADAQSAVDKYKAENAMFMGGTGTIAGTIKANIAELENRVKELHRQYIVDSNAYRKHARTGLGKEVEIPEEGQSVTPGPTIQNAPQTETPEQRIARLRKLAGG